MLLNVLLQYYTILPILLNMQYEVNVGKNNTYCKVDTVDERNPGESGIAKHLYRQFHCIYIGPCGLRVNV